MQNVNAEVIDRVLKRYTTKSTCLEVNSTGVTIATGDSAHIPHSHRKSVALSDGKVGKSDSHW